MENADPEHLKLGLVVVGLDKAPPHLFEPNYTNAQMIHAVSKHHDPIVSQYSVWAAAENPHLTINDIGFTPKEFSQQPDNVRAWIYQLIGNSAVTTNKLIDYVKNCMEDEVPHVRSGLAEGLKETFSTHLEAHIVDWFTKEMDASTRWFIVDHLIRQSAKSEIYKSYALDAFEREAGNSANRRRMEAMAYGTPMYSLYAQMAYDGNPDLFRSVTVVNGNQFNVQNLQAGAVSFTGDANNTGTTHNNFSTAVNKEIQNYLSTAAQQINALEFDADAKKEVLESVTEAQAEPTSEKLIKASRNLEKFAGIASSAVGAVATLVPIATALSKLLGLS